MSFKRPYARSVDCRRKNLYYHFLLVLVFHSFVLGVYFLVFISVLCQLPVLYLLYLFAYRIYWLRLIYLVSCLVCENYRYISSSGFHVFVFGLVTFVL